MNYDKVVNLLKMKQIQRLQGTPHHQGYNLLEHSFVTGMLFKQFAEEEGIPIDMKAFTAVLMHDFMETETGDLCYTVKNLNKETQEAWSVIEKAVATAKPVVGSYTDKDLVMALTPIQFRLFKICDLLDLWCFCQQEKALGNRTKANDDVIRNCRRIIYNICSEKPEECGFMSVFNFMSKFENRIFAE